MTATNISQGKAGFSSAVKAAFVLAIGMGFGRFAFTAIYPHMVSEGVLTLGEGSLVASANYVGYLIGAILALRVHAHNAHKICLWSMIGTAVCLAILAILTSTWIIIAIRAIAGIFSALSIVAASIWLLESRGHFGGSAILYAGVGVGIALSSELLILCTFIGLNSAGMWLILGIISLVVSFILAPSLMTSNLSVCRPTINPPSITHPPVAVRPLVTLYGLAGLGYIVTATYLPLLVKTALPNLDSAHIWAVFGIGAAPSCFLWHYLHEKLGTHKTLRLNLMIQAVGVSFPILTQSAIGYLISALLVGGTFMGTVTIAMPAAQRAISKTNKNLLATMTLVYGIGQIIGPVLADWLYGFSNTFSSSLLMATAALVSAILIGRNL